MASTGIDAYDYQPEGQGQLLAAASNRAEERSRRSGPLERSASTSGEHGQAAAPDVVLGLCGARVVSADRAATIVRAENFALITAPTDRGGDANGGGGDVGEADDEGRADEFRFRAPLPHEGQSLGISQLPSLPMDSPSYHF